MIIGSTAIKHYYPDFPREPKDLDYAVRDSNLYVKTKGVEYLENPIILKYSDAEYLEPELLLTLKVSHIFWNVFWEKHMFDIQFLLSKGNKINTKIFYELYEYWNKYHSENKRSDLKMSKADFFNNALKKYDHDYLHTLINPTPTYIGLLADGAEVEISEKKFNEASDETKKNLIREEVSVMGFERFRHLNYKHAYEKMLKKYLISHAPLYVALYLIENFIELHKPTTNFIQIINEKL